MGFFSFTAFISVPGVPAGFSANQKDGTSETDELPISLLCSISAPFSLSLPAPFLFSVICSLACSFSLINSLIKDTTSKSQLRGLCLPASVRDGNKRRKQARRRLLLLLLLLRSLPPPHPQLLPALVHLYHQQSSPQCPSLSRAKNCLMPKVNSGATLPES